ncbi:MAG TPA: penicillin-binding protein 2 [Acidimicrobiales bacterium]|nr:penicillin-binding protein 2 [Acidimicrobiales bacterium]
MVVTADRRVRFRALALVCLGVFAALFARLWYLQVLNAPTYEHVATLTSTRTVQIPAPRGRILDRTGKVLVDNVPTKVVAIDRQKLEDASNSDAVISRVATLLNHFEKPKTDYTAEGIKHDLAVNQVGPFDPVPLAENVSDELLVELIEHKADYPGVVAETRLLRQYHYGNLAAQVLGRVGPIPEEVWKAHEDDDDPYPKDAQVGLSGVEETLEKYLRGTDGERVVEVTPAGKVVRTVKTVQPVPGNDVELTIDIDAQATAEEALSRQVEVMRASRGNPPVPTAAAALLQPGTGQVMAMASYPTFDPSVFVPAITQKQWDALNDDPAKPMLNHVISATYPAGSTFKLSTAIAGLQNQLITPASTFNDQRCMEVGGTRYCNDETDGALGYIDLATALTRSSNVYFFDIGKRLWEGRGRYGDDALGRTAKELGFGEPTGIDLPGEASGIVPSPEWKQKVHDDDPANYPYADWYTGTNMHLAIGQGDLTTTPLQLANAYALLANHGDQYRPTLLLRVLKPFAELDVFGAAVDPEDVVVAPEPTKIGHIDLDPSWQASLMAGFTGVTENPVGTGHKVFAGFPLGTFPVAGKTGTAEMGDDPGTNLARSSTGWFAGFGPANDPRYLGVAVLEQAGYGSDSAAPVVRDMLEPIATSGAWPTVEPTIPSSPPPATTTTTATTSTTLPGDAAESTGSTTPGAVAGANSDTTETTTAGAVAAGGR